MAWALKDCGNKTLLEFRFKLYADVETFYMILVYKAMSMAQIDEVREAFREARMNAEEPIDYRDIVVKALNKGLGENDVYEFIDFGGMMTVEGRREENNLVIENI